MGKGADVTAKVKATVPSPGLSLPLAAWLAAIVESSDDAIVSKTLEGQILSWNAGATRIFGYEAAEAIGKPITLIIPPELHAEEREILRKLRNGERIDHFDTVRVAKDGHRIAISLTVSPVRDGRGNVIGASKVARDISERRRAEQALRASTEQLAAQAHALTKLSALSTRLWRSRRLEEGLEEMLSAVIELLGADKGNVQLLDPATGVLSIAAHQGFEPEYLEFFREVRAGDNSACARALRSRERVIIEDVEQEESYRPYLALARAAGYRAVVSTPLIGFDGTVLGAITTHTHDVRRPTPQDLSRLDLYLRQASDFIQRCKIDQVMRQNELALREADRRKDEFLALLAHELRNPLAPIRYALAAAKKPGRTREQQRRAEEIIERQIAHMSRLLDDLLDISRITHGTLALQRSRAELTLVIGAALETARPMIEAKHHTLSLDLPRHPVQLEADAVRLAQVFANLLINAAKYTDRGGQLQLRAREEGGEVIVVVRDNGIGIAPEMMPRLFTLFTQGRATQGRSQEGLGVGLALVRGLVELHGGRVEAHSDGPGRGSEFTVRLPVGAAVTETPAAEAATEETAGSALRVLIVDDSRDAADTCATLLELSGHRVQTAYSGRRALEVAETFRPHVLLLDIGLPDIDGYQLARTIRSAPWGRRTQLVAVSGWGQEEDRRRALEVGFDHHLTKPVAAEELDGLLRALGAELPPPSPSEPARPSEQAQQ
jgi:PAS domain S-box-containing protein